MKRKKWSTYNFKYQIISGNALPSKLRLSVTKALGHYQKIDEIESPLLSQFQIEKRLSEIEDLSPAITDVIFVRETGIWLLKIISEQITE